MWGPSNRKKKLYTTNTHTSTHTNTHTHTHLAALDCWNKSPSTDPGFPLPQAPVSREGRPPWIPVSLEVYCCTHTHTLSLSLNPLSHSLRFLQQFDTRGQEARTRPHSTGTSSLTRGSHNCAHPLCFSLRGVFLLSLSLEGLCVVHDFSPPPLHCPLPQLRSRIRSSHGSQEGVEIKWKHES